MTHLLGLIISIKSKLYMPKALTIHVTALHKDYHQLRRTTCCVS